MILQWFRDFRSRRAFIRAYCKRSQRSWRQLRQHRMAVRCNCGDESCEGWAMISRACLTDDIVLGLDARCACGGTMILHPRKPLVWICDQSKWWNRKQHAYLVAKAEAVQ